MIRDFDTIALNTVGSHDCVIYGDYPSAIGGGGTVAGGTVARCVLVRAGQGTPSARWICRTSYSQPIACGDLVEVDGQYWLMVETLPKVQCHSCHARVCNASITILRDVAEVTDTNGYLVSAASVQTIVDAQPCVIADNIANLAAYGVGTWTADNPVLRMQLNSQTAAILANDFFVRAGEKYRVLALGWQDTKPNGTSGVLTVTARKEAGNGNVVTD